MEYTQEHKEVIISYKSARKIQEHKEHRQEHQEQKGISVIVAKHVMSL